MMQRGNENFDPHDPRSHQQWGPVPYGGMQPMMPMPVFQVHPTPPQVAFGPGPGMLGPYQIPMGPVYHHPPACMPAAHPHQGYHGPVPVSMPVEQASEARSRGRPPSQPEAGRPQGKTLRDSPMVRPPPSREAQQGWGDRERAPAEAVLDSPVHVLTSRIKEAGSLARLHALSMVTWCHMNSIHVSAFICKAARLIGNQKESNTGTHVRNWFGALLHEAIQMSADLKARELANIAWACAKVQQVVGARHSFVDWRHLMSLREAIHTSMPSMDAQGLANSLWSLSKLQVDLPGQWLVSYTQALKTRLVNFNEQELANTLLGLAQAQSDARPTINEATLMVTAECGNKMASFSTQGLSNTIWALGRLSCKPPQPWIDAFLRTCVEKFDQFTPQGLSNTMSGFALLSISPPDVLWASIHAKVVAESENFTVPTVATMLHAMATMATQGPPGIVEALVKRASVCTSHMSASFLASVLWSLGTLSHQLLPASSAAFSRRLGNIAHEMGAQDIANVLYAAAKAPSLELSIESLIKVSARVSAVSPEMTPQHIANTLWALGKLRLHPGNEGAESLLEAFLCSLQSIQPKELVMALHGLSTLDLAGQGASDSATEAAVTGTLCQAFMSGALAPSAIADIMHAVAVSFPSALTQGVVRAALGAIHASHPRLRGSHALALGRALQEHVDASEEVGLPPLESVECVIADLVAATGALPSLEEDSGIHESLREAASAAGLQATAPATAVSRLHTVDAEVTVEVEEPGEASGESQSVFVLVFGPENCMANCPRLVGQERLRMQQLARQAPVAVLNVGEWNTMPGTEPRSAYLKQEVLSALKGDRWASQDGGAAGQPQSALSIVASPFRPVQNAGVAEPPTPQPADLPLPRMLEPPTPVAPRPARSAPADAPETPLFAPFKRATTERSPAPLFTPGARIETPAPRRNAASGRTPKPMFAVTGDENVAPVGGKATPTPIKVKEVLRRGGRGSRIVAVPITPGAPMSGIAGAPTPGDRRTAGPHKSPLPMGRTPKPGWETPAPKKNRGGHAETPTVAALSERTSNVLDFGR